MTTETLTTEPNLSTLERTDVELVGFPVQTVLDEHRVLAAKTAERKKAAKTARKAKPFQPWRCLKCSFLIEDAEDAAQHKLLNMMGPNKCAQIAKAVAADGKPAKKKHQGRGRRLRSSGIDRSKWKREVAFVADPTRFGPDGQPVQKKVWTVETKPQPNILHTDESSTDLYNGDNALAAFNEGPAGLIVVGR
jgi:hypothetical protein